MVCIWCKGRDVVYRLRMKKRNWPDEFACALCAPVYFNAGWLFLVEVVEELTTGRVLWSDGVKVSSCEGT